MTDKTMFTTADCGCSARAWQESDGSEWVDFELCELHASAPELQAENERLRAELISVLDIAIRRGDSLGYQSEDYCSRLEELGGEAVSDD